MSSAALVTALRRLADAQGARDARADARREAEMLCDELGEGSAAGFLAMAIWVFLIGADPITAEMLAAWIGDLGAIDAKP